MKKLAFCALLALALVRTDAQEAPPDTQSAAGEAGQTSIVEVPAGNSSPSDESFRLGEAAEAPAFNAGSPVLALLQMLVVLVLVAAAIYALVFFLKKQSGLRADPDPYLKILARAPLTPKASCAVVSIGDKAYLVGVTDEQVSLLSEVADKEVVDALLLDAANREIASQSRRLNFRALLLKWTAPNAKTGALSKGSANSAEKGGQPAGETGENTRLDSLRAHKERLGRL